MKKERTCSTWCLAKKYIKLYLKCPYSKKYEINSNKIFKVVKIVNCHHLEVLIN